MHSRPLPILAGILLALTGVLGVHQATAAQTPQAAAVIAAPVTLRIGTWNICGEYNGCPNVTRFQAKADMVYNLVKRNFLHAVLLSEVCEWHVSELLRQFRLVDPSWDAQFQPVRQIDTAGGWIARRTRVCDRPEWSNVTGDKHVLGIAVLSNGGFDQPTVYELPTPASPQFITDTPMVCVRKISPAVRLCEAHFTSPGNDPNETWRRAQVARVAEIVASFGADRIVFGGDLNALPPDRGGGTILAPLYAQLRECAQVNADNNPSTPDARTGPDTARWTGGTGKIDYLFVRSQQTLGPGLVSACTTQSPDATTTPNSDHAPVFGTFLL